MTKSKPKFRIGESVVLINDDFEEITELIPTIRLPEIYKTYTVRDLVDCPNDKIGVLLEEVINTKLFTLTFGFYEPNFNQDRFKPIINEKILM